MENQVNLSLSDLAMLKEIVEVAASRGAFRAEEMSNVGQCYDRLSSWLATMIQKPSEDTDTQEPTQGE